MDLSQPCLSTIISSDLETTGKGIFLKPTPGVKRSKISTLPCGEAQALIAGYLLYARPHDPFHMSPKPPHKLQALKSRQSRSL